MPLPVDVGQALAAYLSQARPSTRIRGVFLAAKAPTRPSGGAWSATSRIGPVTELDCPGLARIDAALAGDAKCCGGAPR